MLVASRSHLCRGLPYRRSKQRLRMKQTQALFSFGVIADVQYGDKENKASRSRPESLMRYRNGISKLNNAVQEWTKVQSELSFALNLGDIIDGNIDPEATYQDFETVLQPIEQLRAVMDVHHVIGNHCLRMPFDVLLTKLEMKEPYYSRKIHKGWRLVVLNSNDLGVHAEGAAQQQETREFMGRYPLASQPQIQPWNGGVASHQIEWLRRELEMAKTSGETVIVACHHPFGQSSARETHMAWNSPLIESIVLESNTVALVLSGHDHMGGYSHINNTHFLTLPGVVEAPDEMDAFAIVHVTPDEIVVEGRGTVLSQTLSLKQLR